jgi:DNA-binding LytR/AlgR family response regulator
MRMESDASGREVIQAARNAPYHPAVALLTAYPEDDFGDLNADKILVKARQTAILIREIEKLLETHAAKLHRLATAATAPAAASVPAKQATVKKTPAKRMATKKMPGKKVVARKKTVTKKRKR